MVQNENFAAAIATGLAAASVTETRSPLEGVIALTRPVVVCVREQIENGRTYVHELAFGDPSEPYRREGLALSARLEDGIARLLARDARVDGGDARTLARVITSVIHISTTATVYLHRSDDAILSGAGYALQVRKELQWLPVIADGVSLPVPEIVGLGRPGEGYPFEWTVRRWIDDVPVRDVPGLDREVFAAGVAAFLLELGAIDTGGGPEAGAHSAGRGGPLSQFDTR